MDFENLKKLNEKSKNINIQINKEIQKICTNALIEKNIAIGEKIKYKDKNMFLVGLFVKNIGYKEEVEYKVCFSAKKEKKDGTMSLHDEFLFYPNFSEIEKI